MRRYDGLTTGTARFAADLAGPATLELVLVRSPLAHARVVAVDTAVAASMPGVVGVFTAADLDLLDIWEIMSIPEHLAQPVLARGVVRYVGERVVAVLAESLGAGLDAAEAVVVDFEPLPAVVGVDAAVAPGAPLVIEAHGSNVALSWAHEPPAGAFDAADVVVEGVADLARLAQAPMEGFAVVAAADARGRVTMHASTQAPEPTQVQTARTLGLAASDVRVVTPRVGGGFGGKAIGGVGEYVLAAALARRTGRAVRYAEPRGVNLTTMHGRGQRLAYRLHARRDATIVGLEVDELADCGAYPTTNSVEPGKTLLMLCGPYRVPAVRFAARSVLTNTAPSGAYRGPGRSEASAVLERSLDALAGVLGLDPVEVRRRNLLRPDELPAATVTGAHNDEADYHAVLDRALAEAGWHAHAHAHAAARAADGRSGHGTIVTGIGLATVVDSTAWFARTEPAEVAVLPGGRVRLAVGTASAGQEHGAAFAAIVASVLPVDVADVEVVEGDTAAVGGFGSSGSRSLQLGGAATRQASEVVCERARRVAASLLEAAVDDVVVHPGGFGVRGVPARLVTLADVAAPPAPENLVARCVYEQHHATYPFAAHVAEVELDTDTGAVRVRRHVAVTDCGTVVDPPGATGQVAGAAVQGIGQALYEAVAYDADGNPRTANLAEYLVPGAPDVVSVECHFVGGPARANTLGAKGVGEIGLIAAPIAVRAAVLDALRAAGVADPQVELPCTPERVWRALATRSPGLTDPRG